jgi:hypothetical protein
MRAKTIGVFGDGRKIPARYAGVCIGCALAILTSGCCTAVLKGPVSKREHFHGFSQAYRHKDSLLVAYTTQRAHGDTAVQRYVRLSPAGKPRLFRGRIASRVADSALGVALVERNGTVPHGCEHSTVTWWRPDRYAPAYCFSWEVAGQPVEAQVRIDHWYVPGSQYPTLLLLAPVTLALDALTSPVQAAVFAVVWTVDWTQPYR